MRSKLTNFYLNLSAILMVVICQNVEAQQSRVQQKPVFVIVHGAWGGSWAFRKVDSLMTEQNCIVYRPSLTGLGERVHLASADVNLSTTYWMW